MDIQKLILCNRSNNFGTIELDSNTNIIIITIDNFIMISQADVSHKQLTSDLIIFRTI